MIDIICKTVKPFGKKFNSDWILIKQIIVFFHPLLLREEKDFLKNPGEMSNFTLPRAWWQ